VEDAEGARCRMQMRWRCGHMWSMMQNRVDMMWGYMQRILDIILAYDPLSFHLTHRHMNIPKIIPILFTKL
jgi:hypothetical protein